MSFRKDKKRIEEASKRNLRPARSCIVTVGVNGFEGEALVKKQRRN
jgi:hypothetical protein